MKNKLFSLAGILVIMLVFGMTVIGCDIPEEEDSIIGNWVDTGMTSLKFNTDNTVDVWVVGWGTKTYNFEFDGKTLIITDFDGNSGSGTVRFETVNEQTKLTIYNFNGNIGHLFFIERTYIKRE